MEILVKESRKSTKIYRGRGKEKVINPRLTEMERHGIEARVYCTQIRQMCMELRNKS